jgi:hypothetical protein
MTRGDTRMLRRFVGSILMASIFAGCRSVGSVQPRPYITTKRPDSVWVWKSDNSVVLVRGPHFLAGDTTTIIGMVGGDSVQIPLDQVRKMKTLRTAPQQTLVLVLAGVGGLVGVSLAIAHEQVPRVGPCGPDCGR